jgi:hypothetical protein
MYPRNASRTNIFGGSRRAACCFSEIFWLEILSDQLSSFHLFCTHSKVFGYRFATENKIRCQNSANVCSAERYSYRMVFCFPFSFQLFCNFGTSSLISRHIKIHLRLICISYELKHIVFSLTLLKKVSVKVPEFLFEFNCSLSIDDVWRLSDTASQRFCSICLTNLAQLYNLLLPVIWQFVLPLLAQPAVW